MPAFFFMATILTIRKNLQGLNLHQLVVDSVDETKDTFKELNTQQMSEGKLNTDDEITYVPKGYTGYSKPYARKRQRMGLQTKHVDLKVEGDYYEGYTAKVNDTDVELSSTVPHARYIEQMYTNKVLGLTPENHKTYVFERFWGVLKPKISQAIKLDIK
jgi:hypothetical protein